MVRGELTVPVVRKWGYPWLQFTKEEAIATYLPEPELRQLYRRCGYPSVGRLYRILKNDSHHDVESKAIEALTKVCHYSQLVGVYPTRFKFTIHDDKVFNFEIILDIFYMEGNKPVLHIVDAATTFIAARLLLTVTARDVCEVLRLCWIDIY
jgi:hypothetical protein